jgi:hypothetical protein
MTPLEFCEKYLKYEDYTINSDNTIDVDGNVYLLLGNMKKLPVKFGKVFGSFDCSYNKLTTLEGCPNYVGGYFYCHRNKLTTLEGCPKYIGDYFSCDNNKLSTLEYGPIYVGGYFNCSGNKLTNLEHCPNYVGGDFFCLNNKLTTLKGIEKCEIIRNFYCRNNNIPPENYIYILTAKIGGDIKTGKSEIKKILV